MKKSKMIYFLLIFAGIIAAAFIIECVGFNFHALFEKADPVTFTVAGNSDEVQTEITYVPLSEEKKAQLEYEENYKKKAEEAGQVYEIKEDPSIVTYDGELCQKVYNYTVLKDLPAYEYIGKVTVDYATVSTIGYHVTLNKNGEKQAVQYSTLYSVLGKDTVNINRKADQVSLTITTTADFDKNGVSFTVKNPFYINFYRVFFMVAAAVLFVLLFFTKEYLIKKVEVVFISFSLLIGLCMLLLIGTNQYSWDEQYHWTRSYENSFLSTIYTTEAAMDMKGLLTPKYNTFSFYINKNACCS